MNGYASKYFSEYSTNGKRNCNSTALTRKPTLIAVQHLRQPQKPWAKWKAISYREWRRRDHQDRRRRQTMSVLFACASSARSVNGATDVSKTKWAWVYLAKDVLLRRGPHTRGARMLRWHLLEPLHEMTPQSGIKATLESTWGSPSMVP